MDALLGRIALILIGEGVKRSQPKLESAIAKMHGIGFAVGDLSLSNVLINDSLEIKTD